MSTSTSIQSHKGSILTRLSDHQTAVGTTSANHQASEQDPFKGFTPVSPTLEATSYTPEKAFPNAVALKSQSNPDATRNSVRITTKQQSSALPISDAMASDTKRSAGENLSNHPVASTKRQKTVHRNAFLGLDHGSSATRATLLKPGDTVDEFIDVRDPECPPEGTLNGLQFNFPSAINPTLGGGTVGHAALQSGSWTNTKYWIYELVRTSCDSDVNVAEYIDQQLKSTFKDAIINAGGSRKACVHDKIRRLIVAYFAKIQDAVAKTCSQKGLVYDSLAVTIPATWDKPFQRVYSEILEEAFPHIPPENIIFVFEAEAIGHYILQDHCTPYTDTLQMLDSRQQKPYDIMVIDFGGHTVNGTSFHFKWENSTGNKSDKPAFFSIESPWGVPGGLEFYAHIVEKAIREDPRTLANPDKDELVRTLMDYLRVHNSLRDTRFTLLSKHGKWEPADDAGAQALYNGAFKEPLKLVRNKIREKKNNRTLVIITGGSYWNQAALNDTLKEIKRHSQAGWKSHVLHMQQHTTSMGMAVAHGAALALANSMSVGEFLDGGAAFAVSSSSHSGFKERSPLLLHNGKSVKVSRELKKDSELRIICDPSHGPVSEGRSHRASIMNSCAYDFVNIGHRCKGQYVYEMKYMHQDGRDVMFLKETARIAESGNVTQRK